MCDVYINSRLSFDEYLYFFINIKLTVQICLAGWWIGQLVLELLVQDTQRRSETSFSSDLDIYI